MDKETFTTAVGCYIDQYQALNGRPDIDESGAMRRLDHSHVATVYQYSAKEGNGPSRGVTVRSAAIFLMQEAEVRVYHVLDAVLDSDDQLESPLTLRRIPETDAIDVGNGFVLPAEDPSDDIYVPYPGHAVEGGIGRQKFAETIQALLEGYEDTAN